MSYDLYFRTRENRDAVGGDEFAAYFAGRRYYIYSTDQAVYENPDTGVYLIFEREEEDRDAEDDDEDGPATPLAFNLNYNRPHAFGLEAVDELAAFVDHFDLTVCDPQLSGMGEGEFSREGFLAGWNAGNMFGYRSILNHGSESAPMVLPEARITALWRWNYQRKGRQEALSESAFVPKIAFFDINGKVATGVAWADGIPILLPEVDIVLVPRKELAPRGFLRHATEDVALISWQQVEPLLASFVKVEGDPLCYELFYEHRPQTVERLLCAATPPDVMPQRVHFDQILDQELYEAARRAP